MPTVADYPHRFWSPFFSLFFGPLYLDPPRLPVSPATPPVTGATGGIVTRLGDRREGGTVRLI